MEDEDSLGMHILKQLCLCVGGCGCVDVCGCVLGEVIGIKHVVWRLKFTAGRMLPCSLDPVTGYKIMSMQRPLSTQSALSSSQ